MLREFRCEYACNGSLLAYRGLDGVIDEVINRVMSFGQRWALFGVRVFDFKN